MTTEPELAYLVCATPRSGSTLLCEMLRETGCAGRPLEHFEILRHSGLPRQPREYFLELDAPDLIERLEPTRSADEAPELARKWWQRVLAEGQTENRVWGGKLMWGHVEDFVCRARELPGLEDADLWTALCTLLPRPQLVFATRGEKVYQAVSLWRAVQTQAWRAGGEGKGTELIYDFRAIDHLVAQLESDERSWEQWFERVGVEPVRVEYAELDADPRAVVMRVLESLGLGDVTPPWVPTLPRQRDELSVAWVERYRREREKTGAEQAA
jgi:LPS sulfotransferase NodH